MTNASTVKCPYCSSEVATAVAVCPNCAATLPVSPVATDPEPEPAVQPQGPGPDAAAGIAGTPTGKPIGPVFPAPAFGSAPHMGPSWGQPTTPGSSKGAYWVIGFLAAMLLLGGVMCTGLLVFVVQQGDAPDQPAVPLPLNQPVPGYVDSSNPQARYRFVIEQPGPVTVAVTGDFDSYLELYQEDSRQPLMEDDDSGGNLDPLLTTALAPGSYVALVRAFTDGTQGSFVLTVEAPAEQGRQPQGPPAGLPVPAQTHRATVVETTGQAPVAAHTTCDVYITSAPAQNGLNCRVRVLCGGQVLYGRDGEGANSYGYNQCVVTGSPDGIQAVEAHDRGHRAHDGDPMMDLQTAQGRVTITDSNAAGHWSVTLQLTGPNGGNGPQTTT